MPSGPFQKTVFALSTAARKRLTVSGPTSSLDRQDLTDRRRARLARDATWIDRQDEIDALCLCAAR
jgi:hypothetical protein